MTVSRTLHRPDRVSAATAKKVLASIQELGYRPNKQAGLLASGRSQLVAALIPNIASPMFAESVQGLSDHLHESGLELMLAPTGYSIGREEQQLRAVMGWAPAAIVVTGRLHTAGARALLEEVRASNTPVIEWWDRRDSSRGSGFAQIGFDHRDAGVMMARHLLERGYRKLAYVDSGVPEDFRAHERGEGFLEAVGVAGGLGTVYVAERLEPLAAGRRMLQALCESGLPEALAFANDQLAAGAILQALELGISIPGQLAILGFGDFPIAAQLAGGLSTVWVPRYEMGAAAARTLLAALAQDPVPDLPSLEPTIVQRAST